MKTYDRRTGLFWLALSISVFIESLRLGIGTLHNPGKGFMAFGGFWIIRDPLTPSLLSDWSL